MHLYRYLAILVYGLPVVKTPEALLSVGFDCAPEGGSIYYSLQPNRGSGGVPVGLADFKSVEGH